MHAGDMLLSNPPATAGVAGVTSVNTRTGVVTLVPSDVNITAAVDKGVVYMDGTHYANSAAFTWDKTTHTLTLGGGVDGTLTLGATPFVFKDLGGGVLQLGDPNFTWTKATQRIGLKSDTGSIAWDSGGGDIATFGFENSTLTSVGALFLRGIASQTVDGILARRLDDGTGNTTDLGFVDLGGGVTVGAVQSGTPSSYTATFGIVIDGAGSDPGYEVVMQAGSAQWAFWDATGNSIFAPVADNAQDIGTTNTNLGGRVHAIYVGTEVRSPLYSVASGAGNSGITTTITTGSLVGKTITVQGGIITGFA